MTALFIFFLITGFIILNHTLYINWNNIKSFIPNKILLKNKIYIISNIFTLVVSFIFGLALVKVFTEKIFVNGLTVSYVSYLEVFLVIFFYFSFFLLLYIICLFDLFFYQVKTLDLYKLILLVTIKIVMVLLLDLYSILDFKILFTLESQGILFATFLTLFFFLVVRFSKESAMGEGDLYLIACISLFLGFPNSLISILVTLLVGSIFGVFILTLKKERKNLIVPFGPFLLIGFVVALGFGADIFKIIFI